MLIYVDTMAKIMVNKPTFGHQVFLRFQGHQSEIRALPSHFTKFYGEPTYTYGKHTKSYWTWPVEIVDLPIKK